MSVHYLFYTTKIQGIDKVQQMRQEKTFLANPEYV